MLPHFTDSIGFLLKTALHLYSTWILGRFLVLDWRCWISKMWRP